uniref:RING-type domain-containing protein n=1 Tax=Plectus sambesii TaxID=2011161 RepID=A0A914V664_9BILA
MSGVGGNDISSSSTSSRVAEPHHNRHRRPKTRGGNRPTAQREEAAAGSGRSVYYQTAQPYNSGQEQWYPTQGQSEANFAPTEETYGRPPSWLLELAGQVPDQSSNMLPYQGAGMLNPNARPFVPRQNQRRPPPPQYRHEAPSTRRAPVPTENSTTENLRDRLTEQLERETYECMICCQAIFANHWLWSCSQCFHMFHFHRQTDKSCITRWAHKSYDEETGWRCPSCQQANRDLPKEYRCFCGKEVQPRTRRGEDIPHSCGQTCHKERGFGCPHKCSLPCHPGPCPQCPRTVVRHCLCGDEEKSVRCGSNQEIRCSKACDKLLNCGLHKCTGVCHAGGCEVCQETIVQKCHCGSAEREVACTALNLKENGYSCGRPCAGMFACGQHACENKCHPGDCGPCPLSPERLVRCPCGRTEITALLSAPRQFCSDQVPVCNNVCDKVLGCGSQAKPHRCKAKCHNGPCPPCPDNSSLRCRCQALTKTLPCSELAEYTEDNPLLCERRCKKQKSCKQHKCQERCCIDVDHLCLQVCNRKLDCGTHLCDRLCHVGQCPRCLQASFEEQRCLCGVTVREPPIPCGASLPPCSEPCAREHSCDHPVMHNCHSEVDCPLCTALTRKWCYGKHEVCNERT